MEKKEMWRTYYENGNIKEEVPIVRGKLNGIGKYYNEKGEIIEKRVYQNDVCMGNPFVGQDVISLADSLGCSLATKEEWEEAMEEEGEVIEINSENTSIILLK